MKYTPLQLIIFFIQISVFGQPNISTSGNITMEYIIDDCTLYLRTVATVTIVADGAGYNISTLKVCENPFNEPLYLLENCQYEKADSIPYYNGMTKHVIEYVQKINKKASFTAGLCQNFKLENGSDYAVIDNCMTISNSIAPFEGEIPHLKIDTVFIYDTIPQYVTVYDSISVTDTLIIDAELSKVDPSNNLNRLLIYPNPTRDYLFIEFNDNSMMSEYSLKIVDQLERIVYETDIDEPIYEINLSTWTGYGMYFIQVIDPNGIAIETRKIILR